MANIFRKFATSALPEVMESDGLSGKIKEELEKIGKRPKEEDRPAKTSQERIQSECLSMKKKCTMKDDDEIIERHEELKWSKMRICFHLWNFVRR
jgi:hypothetical protein